MHACGRLANSASTLLPVSNLTNLLAFASSGLGFGAFTVLMAGPWLVAIAVEYGVLRRWFRADLRPQPTGPAGSDVDSTALSTDPARTVAPPAAVPPTSVASTATDLSPAVLPLTADPLGNPSPTAVPADGPMPLVALVVLALTLTGFALSGPLGVEPVEVAASGALVLAIRALVRRTASLRELALGADPLFCLFVLALGVVVAALGAQGPTGAVGALLPDTPTLPDLLAVAGLAAVLAGVVNNLPATLVLLAALGPDAPTGLILAVLIGVNIGPNLTWVGSLATLLWRRVLGDRGVRVGLGEFTALVLLTVPVSLAAATVALWAALSLTGW